MYVVLKENTKSTKVSSMPRVFENIADAEDIIRAYIIRHPYSNGKFTIAEIGKTKTYKAEIVAEPS